MRMMPEDVVAKTLFPAPDGVRMCAAYSDIVDAGLF